MTLGFAIGALPSLVSAQQQPTDRRNAAAASAAVQPMSLDTLHANYLRRRERPCVDHVNLSCRLYDVSIPELLAHPGLFHGKRVRILGFLRLEFEGRAVYASREDERQRLHRNGFWVEFLNQEVRTQARRLEGHYIFLEGTFDAEFEGHEGLWSGSIRDIYRVVDGEP